MDLKRALDGPAAERRKQVDSPAAKRRKHDEQIVSHALPASRLRNFLKVSLPSAVSLTETTDYADMVQKWSKGALKLLGDAVVLLSEELLGDVIESITWLSRGDLRLPAQTAIRLNATQACMDRHILISMTLSDDYIAAHSTKHPWILPASEN